MYKAISESELEIYFEDWTSDFPEKNPDMFKEILWRLGVDVHKEEEFEVQDGLFHRNRYNQVVQCRRWVGAERLDPEWLSSPYVSIEALYASSDVETRKDMSRMMKTITDKEPFKRERLEFFIDEIFVKE